MAGWSGKHGFSRKIGFLSVERRQRKGRAMRAWVKSVKFFGACGGPEGALRAHGCGYRGSSQQLQKTPHPYWVTLTVAGASL